MMKILFLSPRIDAEHKIARSLAAENIALLFPDDATEAWQMLQLHGTSIDLAVLNLEDISGKNERTLKLLKKIKVDESQADLPIILTTDKWSDDECAAHQLTPQGANAYIKWPFTDKDLLSLIQAVLGGGIPAESEESPRSNTNVSVLLDASASEAPPEVPSDISPQPPRDENLEALLDAPSSVAQKEEPSEIGGSTPLDESDLPPPLPQVSSSNASSLTSASISLVNDNSNGEVDPEAAQSMPYLFGGAPKDSQSQAAGALFFSEPVGDAVVPGGAAHSPDLETFKKYLLLREQDVAVLSNQLKAAHDQIEALEKSLRDEKANNAELTHVTHEQKHRIDEFEKEKNLALESQQLEIIDLRFQNKVRADKARVLEVQVRDVSDEMERLKERVRSDIRKIRVREKELENRLEIMKRDSEALLGARENKIIELKRKLDLMEFNMDLLQDQYAREKENSIKLKERLAKAAQVVRVVGGLLDSQKDGSMQSEVGAKDLADGEEQKVS